MSQTWRIVPVPAVTILSGNLFGRFAGGEGGALAGRVINVAFAVSPTMDHLPRAPRCRTSPPVLVICLTELGRVRVKILASIVRAFVGKPVRKRAPKCGITVIGKKKVDGMQTSSKVGPN